MLIEHLGRRPAIDPAARPAPTAVLCGDVTVGPDTSAGFGAVLTAQSGPIVGGGRPPARILPPEAHDEIWAIQEPLDFPKAVCIDRPDPARRACLRRWPASAGHSPAIVPTGSCESSGADGAAPHATGSATKTTLRVGHANAGAANGPGW